jgi:hypothetical protein
MQSKLLGISPITQKNIPTIGIQNDQEHMQYSSSIHQFVANEMLQNIKHDDATSSEAEEKERIERRVRKAKRDAAAAREAAEEAAEEARRARYYRPYGYRRHYPYYYRRYHRPGFGIYF